MHKHLNQVYYSMKARCYDKNHTGYKWYGGKGIKVSEEFDTVQKFREWALENGADFGLELDRIDVNGDYSPNNCRWITGAENKRNRTDNVWFNGMVLKDYLNYLSEKYNIPFSTLRYRYYTMKKYGLEINDNNIEDILINYKKYDLRQYGQGVDMSDKTIIRDEKGRFITYY